MLSTLPELLHVVIKQHCEICIIIAKLQMGNLRPSEVRPDVLFKSYKLQMVELSQNLDLEQSFL